MPSAYGCATNPISKVPLHYWSSSLLASTSLANKDLKLGNSVEKYLRVNEDACRN